MDTALMGLTSSRYARTPRRYQHERHPAQPSSADQQRGARRLLELRQAARPAALFPEFVGHPCCGRSLLKAQRLRRSSRICPRQGRPAGRDLSAVGAWLSLAWILG
jgi:hypothetical protein